ncbi:MAG TPA: methyltransferase domain-containing protein [Acidimicrobiales bacterium]|nr:methyltransferase domain-containing protein [Acidimicrobiales bacterium]
MERPANGPDDDHYSKAYGRFDNQLYADIRREAFGEDIGQNNWSTAEEHKRFLDWLELTPGDRMLDVACGSGGPTLYLAGQSGCRALGIDNSAQAVAYGTRVAEKMGTEQVEFVQLDADAPLPLPDASFEAVICLDAINHLADRRRALAEWARILRPGGRLLFTDCITLTGLISDAEVAARSRIGRYVFAPLGEDARLIGDAGLQLQLSEDVTESLALLSGRRWRARAARAEALSEIEDGTTYEAHQEVLRTAETLAVEGRLSRYVYLALKPRLSR